LSASRKETNSSSKEVTMDRVLSELQSLQKEVRGLQEKNLWLQTLNHQLMNDIVVELRNAVPKGDSVDFM